MSILDFIGNGLSKADKVYIHPLIPRSKTSNAISAYCYDISHDDILVLVDDTVFGSSKNGLVITKDKIYCKGQLEKPASFSFSENTLFFVEKKMMSVSVYLNNIELINTTQPSYKHIDYLFNKLNDFIKNSFTSHTTPQAAVPSTEPAPAAVTEPAPAPAPAPAPDFNADHKSIYQILPDDGLMQKIKIDKGVDSFFDFFSNGDNRSSSEFVRKEISGFLQKNIVHIRNNYIDKNNIVGLKNNNATMELLIYSLALLRLEMAERYVNENAIEFVLVEGMKEFMSAGSASRDKNIINYMVRLSYESGDSFDDATTSLYIRLLSSNMHGKTVGADFELENLLDKFHNDAHLADASSHEEVINNILGDILYQSIEELGDISRDREIGRLAQRSVDIVLDKFSR